MQFGIFKKTIMTGSIVVIYLGNHNKFRHHKKYSIEILFFCYHKILVKKIKTSNKKTY